MNQQVRLKAEIAKWDWLRPHLEAENFDAVALMTALESETDIAECLVELAEAALEAEALAEAARVRAKQITERASRLELKGEKLRRIIVNAMIQARIDEPIRTATMTLSKRPGQRDLVIMDETKIPKAFYDDVEPKLNRRRLRDALDNGQQVEGAQLGNGGASCTILVK